MLLFPVFILCCTVFFFVYCFLVCSNFCTWVWFRWMGKIVVVSFFVVGLPSSMCKLVFAAICWIFSELGFFALSDVVDICSPLMLIILDFLRIIRAKFLVVYSFLVVVRFHHILFSCNGECKRWCLFTILKLFGFKIIFPL